MKWKKREEKIRKRQLYTLIKLIKAFGCKITWIGSICVMCILACFGLWISFR